METTHVETQQLEVGHLSQEPDITSLKYQIYPKNHSETISKKFWAISYPEIRSLQRGVSLGVQQTAAESNLQ